MKNITRNLFILGSTVLMLSSCGGTSSTSQSSSASSKEESSSTKESSSSSISSEEESSSGEEQTSSQEEVSSISESNSESIDDGFVVSSASFFKAEEKDNDFVPVKKSDLEYGYFLEQPQIVYMDLGVALKETYGKEVPVEEKDGEYIYSCPLGASFKVDPASDTITLHDYDKNNLFSVAYDFPLGLIDSSYAAKYVDNKGSVFHSNDDVTLNLAGYNLDIGEHDGKAYLPFSLVSSLVFTPAYYSSVSWNGTAFYLNDLVNGAISLSGPSTSYATSYYSGKNSETKKEPYFIEYNANSLFFFLDHFYGFRDERFVPFSDYLQLNRPEVYEGLFSADEKTYVEAVNILMENVIGDGHTNARGATSTFGEGKVAVSGNKSDRTNKMMEDSNDCHTKRFEAGVSPNVVRYNGKTAILSFDGFEHANTVLSNDNIAQYAKDNKDTFALFSNAMKEITAHGGIENVIFDVTCNGGGDSNGLIPATGIMDREFVSVQYDPLTKAHSEIHYQIDTNLDGVYDENDGYKGQYKFYILTSAYSFSCANMFPFFAKTNGFAKIIGETSGGGACVVSFESTADGKPFRISGNIRSGEKDKPSVHDDAGVKVDFALEREHFYDDAYLNTFVSAL